MGDTKFCDGYLQLVKAGQPVKGECRSAEFQDYIELISFDFGSMTGFKDTEAYYADQNVGRRGATGGSRMLENHSEDDLGLSMQFLFGGDADTESKYEGEDLGEVDACQFKISKLFDLSSPDLFRSYCSTHSPENRDVFDTATITLCKTHGQGLSKYLKFTFADTVVTSYTLDVGSDGVAKETIGMSFAKLRMEYKVQTLDGKLTSQAAIKTGWNFTDRAAW